MSENIQASERNLRDIFSDSYFFEIPLYQRPYTWTTEEAGELLLDLMDAMEQNSEFPYFIGSIVLIKSENDPRSEIVDGQQRLTTLSMIICVLREIADVNTKDNLDNFIREAGNEIKGTQDRYRLSLRSLDLDFFRSNVQNMGSVLQFIQSDPSGYSDSQRRIFENVRHLHGRLIKRDEETRKSIAKFMVQQCYIVVVSASDRNSAYRIFSVMNDRGLDLSPTDILKAEIIGSIANESDKEISGKRWEDIEETLGRDRFRDLFTHIRMIYSKSKLRRSLQEDFRESVIGEQSGQDFIDSVLAPYSAVYHIICCASYQSTEHAERINVYLTYLNRIDNYDWIPPTMAFFRRHHESAHVLQFIKDLERLAYGLFIRRASVNDRISRYASVLEAIENGDDLDEIDGSIQLSDDEKNEICMQLEGEVYRQPRVPLPLLLRLDSVLSDGAASYDYSVVTIEHVLPQDPRPGSHWLCWFKDEEERGRWTHRLANLVLLSRRKNSAASNWDFERKKNDYFVRNGVSPFTLTTQVIGETEWTPEVLERRQRQLIEALKAEWRLD